ncbi:MAG: hypothetical protein LBK54_10920 [Propionibacteriaceae bacterium]|nr:hypothetical protein [Propionibacteriaceae bacterium]
MSGVSALATSGATIHLVIDGAVVSWDRVSEAMVVAPGLSGVRAIAAVSWEKYALLDDQTVWGWNSGTPYQVEGLSQVEAIAVGAETGYALRTDGTVWTWGAGAGPAVPVAGLADIVGLTAGGQFVTLAAVYAWDSDGRVWGWGANGSGQLCQGDQSPRLEPTVVPVDAVQTVATNGSTTYFGTADGVVMCGSTASGRLAAGAADRLSPTPVLGLPPVTALAVGDQAAYALTGDGTVWSWGFNGTGQLGDGTTDSRTTPAALTEPTGVTAISADLQAYAIQGLS